MSRTLSSVRLVLSRAVAASPWQAPMATRNGPAGRGVFALLARTCPRFAASLALLAVAPPALASDGAFEINQACAAVGCFTGDGPGLPVTILNPGSYRLTSSLDQSVIPGLTTAKDAIQITSDDVHIDLGGFTISCSQSLGGSCGGDASGVHAIGPRQSPRLTNGSIVGMPGHGVDLSGTEGAIVENVIARSNGDGGIVVGSSSRIARSMARANGSDGIWADGISAQIIENTSTDNGRFGIVTGAAVIAHNLVVQNGDTGIVSAGGSTIIDNVAAENTGSGISASRSSTIARNSARANSEAGIFADVGCNVFENTVGQNGAFGLVLNGGTFRDNVINGSNGTVPGGSGVDAGGNVCNGSLSCP